MCTEKLYPSLTATLNSTMYISSSYPVSLDDKKAQTENLHILKGNTLIKHDFHGNTDQTLGGKNLSTYVGKMKRNDVPIFLENEITGI